MQLQCCLLLLLALPFSQNTADARVDNNRYEEKGRPDDKEEENDNHRHGLQKVLQPRAMGARVVRHADVDDDYAYEVSRLVAREKDHSPFSNHTFEGDEEKDEVHEEVDGEEEIFEDNCTHPRQPFPLYNDSCDLVHAECRGKSELIDYLAFVLCDLPKAQVGISIT